MATPITITKISGATISSPSAPRKLKALNHLPARLDAAACREVLSTLNEDWTVEKLAASTKKLDVDDIDERLEYKGLNLSERIELKTALARFGFITAGKPVGRKV
jgi:hypothetical protein